MDASANPFTLYITLQYLRTVNKINKYHWGLYVTYEGPPSGYLLHATDTGRTALDLYKEVRKVSDPRKSKSLVVCLKIDNAPSIQTLDRVACSVRLMDHAHLPWGETQWTCRVWVKEVLRALHENRQILLARNIDTLEQYCQWTADSYISRMGRAKVFNDIDWVGQPTVPMEIDLPSRSYGSSPMETETSGTGSRTGYYGTKPMVTELHTPVGLGNFATKPAREM
ncbi:hypothetical protein ED733_002219 [Metarhizium rileyi]|uniref:Uncharacterized protein n=1 Tax=Metarhizium rileyi (strain RCEF 4871) TaxID=1649241 RepID=A0A5C6G2V2_METRR|nr:hypothetical protein ED733_002219 [Metarhizium rileyi]